MLLLETLECSPITATQIKTWTARDPVLSRVLERVLSAWSNTADETLIPYQRQRDELSLEDGCEIWGNCVVVPEVCCQKVLQELHVGHPEMSKMKSIAKEVVWWPGINADIESDETLIHNQRQRDDSVKSFRSHQLLLHSTCGNGQPIPGSVHIDYAGPF